MELLPQEIAEKLPELYGQERLGEDAVVYIKFFDPCSNWTWYVTEYDGADTFFGLVVGHEAELGYFSLQELKNCHNRLGLSIERDIYFEPLTISELRVQLERNYHRGFI
jgi:hypothetical protein